MTGMTIVDMLGQSGLLTLLGMGVVFTFLIILIVFMSLTTKVLKALGLDKDKAETKGTVAAAPAQDTNAIVAAIAAAVRENNSK